jgi:hypothetical protein
LAFLVSDTSIVIDLERGGLLDDLFKLSHEFVVPDLLFERELKGALGDRLVALGLRIEELTPDEVTQATAIGRQRSMLSTPDTFAYALAKTRVWALLTGDGALRTLASDEGVATHGVLWIIDELHAATALEKARLRAGLVAISTHPRCRLPKAEVTARLVMLEK